MPEILIPRQEDSVTEFKNEKVHPDSLAKEIVAFSNTNGGDIFLGIDDDGTVSGISNTKKAEEKVINICRNNIVPSVVPEIICFTHQGYTVMRIRTDRGIFKPYKVKTTSKFYIRAGSTAVEPTSEELLRLFQEGGLLHFEVSALSGTTQKDIDLVRFRKYCTDFRKMEFSEEGLDNLLDNLQLTDQGRLTVAGNIMFGVRPEYHMPQAGIELFCFSGTDQTSEILDSRVIDSVIPELLESAESFVKKNSRVRSCFNPDQTRRIDLAEYEPFVIREIVVNALIHRDWSIFGQKVRLNMFSDRVEVFSPGGVPNTLNISRMLAGISYYRNPLLSQMLRDYGLSEKMGRGLMKVMNFYVKNSFKLPEFETDKNYFLVRLFGTHFLS